MKLRQKLDDVKLLRFDNLDSFFISFIDKEGILKTNDFIKYNLIYNEQVEWFELLKSGIITQVDEIGELVYIDLKEGIQKTVIKGNYLLSSSKIYPNGEIGIPVINDKHENIGIHLHDDLRINKVMANAYDIISGTSAFSKGGSDLYHIESTTGKVIWKVSVADIGSGRNTFDYKINIQLINNKIICLLEGGEVVAIQTHTGEVAWIFKPEDQQLVIQINEDKIYSAGVVLYEINPENGELLHSMPILDEITKNGFESFYSPMRIYGDYAVLWHSFTMDIFLINLKDFKFEKTLKIKIDWGRKKFGIPIIFNATIIYHNGLLCILDESKKLLILEKEETEDLVQEIIISKEEYITGNFQI